MQFPADMSPKMQSLVIVLSYRFAKNKPGLEQDDLINEALIKFEELQRTKYYDVENPSKAAISTVFYRTIFNHFLNLQNRFIKKLPTPRREAWEIEKYLPGTLQPSAEEYLDTLREKVPSGEASKVFEKLIKTTNEKRTIKQLCEELNMSFFRYQQASYKIRKAIKTL